MNSLPAGRQAVVLVHGVGEQRPMQTLKAFVDHLLCMPRVQRSWWSRVTGKGGPAASIVAPYHSKPDKLTDTLELRRLAVAGPGVERPTDFYELYWAHLMQGTAWSHVTAWFRMLMWRVPLGASWRIQGLWALAWCLVIAAVVAGAYLKLPWSNPAELLGQGAVAGLVVWLVSWVLNGLGLHYVGDAARYLSATPQNVGARKDIRNAVIQLLTKLHDEQPRRYERIVVVGHSLGSVIAYDALTHVWQQRHSVIAMPRASDQPALARAHDMAHRLIDAARNPSVSETKVDALRDSYRDAQRELLAELQQVGIDWRISDLVTLGSPLAHASFLLARDACEWSDLVRERVYPTSPPQFEDARDEGLLERRFSYSYNDRFSLHILHHAALFACTRWTNLYFDSDPIGGPVGGRARFGPGVEDVCLPPTGWWTRTPVAHVRYWSPNEAKALAALRTALDLHLEPRADPVDAGQAPTAAPR